MNAANELLRDLFVRQLQHVDAICEGLTETTARLRPTPDANSITWLLWHSARTQDVQVSDVAGAEQVWTADGWVERFALELPRESHGYGHTSADVAKVVAPVGTLAGYWHAVGDMTLAVVADLTGERLAEVLDEDWDPPVTVSARLVSTVDDCAQHLGQAAYLKGVAAALAGRG